MALEWDRTTLGEWQSKPIRQTWWRIWVNDDGEFVCGMYTYPSLQAAKEHCEKLQAEKDREAAPPAELPQVGSVWGVPGKPETWRKVITIGDCVRYGCFGHGTYLREMADWNHWLRESGAVRIDDGGVRALETEVTHWRTATERLEKSSERLAKELATAEGEVARLRAEHEAVQAERNRLREWKASVSNAIQNIPEFAAGQWGGDKDGWGYHFEVVQYLIRNRDELRAKVGLMEEEAKEMEQELADTVKSRNAFEDQVESAKETIDSLGEKVLAAEAGRDDLRTKLEAEKVCRVYYHDIVYWVCGWIDRMRTGERVVCGSVSEPRDGVQRGLEDIALRLQAVAHERDDLRTECARLRGDALAAVAAKQESEAARGRLMEALRGIEKRVATASASWVALDAVEKLAREAIQREEEGAHPLQSLRDAGGSGWDVIDDPVGYLERREEGVKS